METKIIRKGLDGIDLRALGAAVEAGQITRGQAADMLGRELAQARRWATTCPLGSARTAWARVDRLAAAVARLGG